MNYLHFNCFPSYLGLLGLICFFGLIRHVWRGTAPRTTGELLSLGLIVLAAILGILPPDLFWGTLLCKT